MTYSYADEYNTLHAQLADNSLPSFEHMRNIILDDLDEDGREMLLGFADFNAFYDWFETLSHYDQVDADQSLEEGKALLEVVYLSLLAEFLGDDQPVTTESDFTRRFFSIELSFKDLRLMEYAEFDNAHAGRVGSETLAQQIERILRLPEVEYNGLKAPSIYYTMDVAEDTPANHARIKNIVRAQVLKARAQAKAFDEA
ncbi:TPA: hypothetical protein NIA45_004697 [Pseudomonas aeruginosa]|nr:hypothetical protein [Pseudomonas aeruginosa]